MKSRGNILISRQPKNSTYSPGALADGNLRIEKLDLPPHHLEIRYPEFGKYSNWMPKVAPSNNITKDVP